MNEQKSKDNRSYLEHVTVRDILSESKGFLLFWFVLSGLAILIGAVFNIGSENAEQASRNWDFFGIPQWVWLSIIVGALTWFGRGEEYKFVVPNFGVKSWLFFSLAMAAIFFSFEYFVWWAAAPFFFAVILFAQYLDNLALKGKSNIEAKNGNEEENF